MSVYYWSDHHFRHSRDIRCRPTGDNRVDYEKGISKAYKGYSFRITGDMLAYFCYEA